MSAVCLPGSFPICPLNPQRAAPWVPPGPRVQHLLGSPAPGTQALLSCLARAAGMGDATSLVALREMQANMGFGQASNVSLHTKPWVRGCSLPIALGSRSTVKSHAQPEDDQGLTCRAAGCCLAHIISSLSCCWGPSTGETSQRGWA